MRLSPAERRGRALPVAQLPHRSSILQALVFRLSKVAGITRSMLRVHSAAPCKRRKQAGRHGLLACFLLFGGEALAAEFDSRKSGFDWTGFYAGGHVGYGRGWANSVITGPDSVAGRSTFGSLYGGVQGGYNVLLPSRVLLGVEADLSFPNYLDPDNVVGGRRTGRSEFVETLDYIGTVRGRIGYSFDRWLVYGTGGFAWSNGHVARTPLDSDDEDKRSRARIGWTAGAGVEFAFEREWSVRLEYLYSRFGSFNVLYPDDARYTSRLDFHQLRLGLNRKLDFSGKSREGNGEHDSSPDSSNWEIHGQSTFIYQGNAPFRAAYSGPNSLLPRGEARETLSASAFLGFRLWEGGELYYNPELFQGFGLGGTTGAGGFPNGEAQKSNFPYPRYSTSRLFLRQVVGLGGEQEKVESEYGQLGGKYDVSRVTLQIGRFSVKDLFDRNSYASDPRDHFLNWSLWAGGAFDYPADKLGLGYGSVAELNQKDWALRAGYFLVGDKPNSNNFDSAVFRRGGYLSELELRYALFSQPGKFRVTGWFNSYFSGNYREAVALASAQPDLDPTSAIIETRRGRTKYGYILGVEQAITSDLGLFGRWSWNDGRNEITAFTDIDASLSGGVSLKGTSWGRPEDRIGVGAAVNELSKAHRDYIAAGGLGILIGDGRLNYRTEKILETFYSLNVAKHAFLTFDYQFLQNPGYNADRGPVSVYTVRLHGEW